MRKLTKMQTENNGNRSLFESVLPEPVLAVLRDWKAAGAPGILIGGLALSYYVKPRMTQDIDILLMSDADIPVSVSKFKKTRDHAFQHNRTHVEVEAVTPEYVNTNRSVFEKVASTARESDGFKIASPSGLVALKLGRFSMQDQADIVALINHETIDLTGFGMSQENMRRFMSLLPIAASEKNNTKKT